MIVLASASLARSQLLTQWGIDHQIIPSHINEDSFKQTISDPKSLVEALAQAKAESVVTDQIVLAADTVIVLNHQIIAKPKYRTQAKRIISLLQGQTHQVWTGVCFNHHVFSDMASVTFKPMSTSQIETYLNTNDWVGVAGAYQIQKSIKPYIETIDGDINTIIGLPTILSSFSVY